MQKHRFPWFQGAWFCLTLPLSMEESWKVEKAYRFLGCLARVMRGPGQPRSHAVAEMAGHTHHLRSRSMCRETSRLRIKLMDRLFQRDWQRFHQACKGCRKGAAILSAACFHVLLVTPGAVPQQAKRYLAWSLSVGTQKGVCDCLLPPALFAICTLSQPC